MDKKTYVILLLILIGFIVLIFFPTLEKNDDEHVPDNDEGIIWETDGEVLLHYSQSFNTTISLTKGQNLSFVVRGEHMQDTVTIAIYDSSNSPVTSFAQIGNYRSVNWTAPKDDNYRFVFYNPVRWHKKVHITIKEIN